ncbi:MULTISPECIES: NACHT domain-containing protein [unclassified Nonomuraea]|uniref:NACHT domain-containing protein n=1 Tax=unclassified Nonomuraea TaxID=2593643 RepID=UPI001376BC7D|nr:MULTISPECIES: NACHT domain-containing protein [unclassified Nonomuraea]NBE94496.1 NACHT domain-containing protein [Nonomuraea sp. K271]
MEALRRRVTITTMASMVGGWNWRIRLLWLSSVLLPVMVSVAANQVYNDGVWSGPWIAGTIAVAVLSALVVERFGRVLAPSPGSVADTMKVLAELVQERWSDEVVTRSLGDPPIPVSWHMTRRSKLMDHPHLIADREQAVAGRSDDIKALAAAFRSLRRRRLVITGGRGTGKTTLAIQLMLELIRTRTDDEPVPVLLPVADWDTEARPRFQDWVAERVRTDYAALRTPGNRQDGADVLAARGSILAVLDGLDELPEPARAKVIAKLSDTLMERDQLIITSRTTEYGDAVAAARRPLKAAAVIAPKALDPVVAADYLSAHLPALSASSAWTTVLRALKEGTAPALAEITSTALGLWMVRAVYIDRPDADPAPLVTEYAGDVAALRAHLLDNLLDALLTAHTTISPTTWDAARITGWTRRLARLQAEADGPDLAWWRLTDQALPASRTQRALARTWIGGLSSLVFALPTALTATLTYGPAFGAAFGLCYGLSATQAARTPDFAPLRVRQRLRDFTRGLLSDVGQMTIIMPAGLGLPFVAYSFVAYGWKQGLAALFAALGLGYVTVRMLRQQEKTPARPDENRLPPFTAAVTPQSTWRVNRSLVGVQVMGALFLGATVGFAAAFMNEASLVPPSTSPHVHAGMGVVFGIALGMVNKRQHMWLMSTIALMHLAPSGRLPFRLMRFLHELHHLGVLRTVGPFYQFRHAELHDHLTAAKAP